MTTGTKWFTGIIVVVGAGALVLVALGLFAVAGVLGGLEPSSGERVSGIGDAVAIVSVEGEIEDAEAFITELRGYQKRDGVKAIVVHINSPGGDPVASHEMYEEIQRTRRGGKPVVASFGSLAASGGYYLACGAQTIVSNPGSLTGSIGVITRHTNMEDLLHKLGIQQTTITSGRFKSTGDPSRPLREDEKAYLQAVVNDLHEQFVDIVARSRRVSPDSIRLLADGRVFTGRQAKLLGLVDTLGSVRTAVLLAASLAHISGEPRVIERRRTESMLDRFVGQMVTRTAKELRETSGSSLPFRHAYSLH